MPFREQFFPSSLYLLKVNNRNTRTGCEVCCVSMVNFEHVITGWVLMKEVTLMEKLEIKKVDDRVDNADTDKDEDLYFKCCSISIISNNFIRAVIVKMEEVLYKTDRNVLIGGGEGMLHW